MGISKNELENFLNSKNDKINTDNNLYLQETNTNNHNFIYSPNNKSITYLNLSNNTPYSTKNNNKEKSIIKYSGLNNQGMTCYLNSLLQTLFMTPEFRLNILNWKYDELQHGKKEDCIPYQIKKLFAKLQLKKWPAEETISLTKSFQWGSADAFYQHDIQELCRVLFEAIEISLTPEDRNFINEIFEGQSASVVQCQKCLFESVRKDKYLDISLPIRNEFEKIYNNSLEMALSNYIKIEMLEKDNQYLCDVCKEKVDAKKFIKFEKLPNCLLFQLNRFEYNFMTDMREKITDKVTFPLILDMNLFCDKSEKENNINDSHKLYTTNENQEKNLNKNVYDTNENLNKNKLMPILNENFFTERAEGKINLDAESIKNQISSALLNGENVYELYSIVIHSGTANGGHYYAYIKSFEDDCWYNFNDSDVSLISEKEIENVFGSKNPTGFSSATGYVLMYRKITNNNKVKNIENDVIDEELMKEINEDIKKALEEERAWKERLNQVTVKIYYDRITKEIQFKKDENIFKMKEKILKEFLFEDKHKIEDFMLRNYNKNLDKKTEYIEYEELSLEENNISGYKIYTLQFREAESNQFPVYNPNLLEGNVTFWSDNFLTLKEDKFPSIKFEFDKNDTQREFKAKLLKALNIEGEDAEDFYYFRRLDLSASNFSFIEIFQNPNDKEKPIIINALINGCKIYVERKEYEPSPLIGKKPKFSKFLQVIDNFNNEILICFNRPLDMKMSNKATSTSFISHKWDFSVKVNLKDSILVLKNKIATVLNLGVNDFIIKKYGPSGNEIKDLNALVCTFATADLNIFTQLGTPLNDDELFVNLSFLQYDYSEFKVFPYKFISLDKYILNKKQKVKDIKKDLVKLIEKNINIKIENEENLLVRECIQDKPAKIYSDDTVFGNLEFLENKTILVQEYKRELKKFDIENDTQLSIRFIDFNNWRVDEPIEIHINSNTTFINLGDIINNYYSELKPEDISILRVITPIGITYESLKNSNNFEFILENMDNKLSQYPYYIRSDGCLIFFKNANNDPKNEREATEEELKFYFKNKKEILNGNSGSNLMNKQVNGSAESCTAILLKPDADAFNDNKHIIKPTSGFSEARSILESRFGGKFTTNKHRIKEKNLVIKVKKNMNEEESEKDKKTTENNKENLELRLTPNTAYNNITISNDNCETIMKPNDSIDKKKAERENDNKDYRCNIKENTKESQKIKTKRIIDDYENYEEESNNSENGFMEPLF